MSGVFDEMASRGQVSGKEAVQQLEKAIQLCNRELRWCEEHLAELPPPSDVGAATLLYRDQLIALRDSATALLSGPSGRTTAEQRLKFAVYSLSKIGEHLTRSKTTDP
jgi:hypothetical protein